MYLEYVLLTDLHISFREMCTKTTQTVNGKHVVIVANPLSWFMIVQPQQTAKLEETV